MKHGGKLEAGTGSFYKRYILFGGKMHGISPYYVCSFLL